MVSACGLWTCESNGVVQLEMHEPASLGVHMQECRASVEVCIFTHRGKAVGPICLAQLGTKVHFGLHRIPPMHKLDAARETALELSSDLKAGGEDSVLH